MHPPVLFFLVCPDSPKLDRYDWLVNILLQLMPAVPSIYCWAGGQVLQAHINEYLWSNSSYFIPHSVGPVRPGIAEITIGDNHHEALKTKCVINASQQPLPMAIFSEKTSPECFEWVSPDAKDLLRSRFKSYQNQGFKPKALEFTPNVSL
ncbi:MAG: DNA polymerase III subunit chi [Pseudomonadota bacterium]|nr:DNA polymerase III subunit chi [Pseudomonadota bacterium]